MLYIYVSYQEVEDSDGDTAIKNSMVIFSLCNLLFFCFHSILIGDTAAQSSGFLVFQIGFKSAACSRSDIFVQQLE